MVNERDWGKSSPAPQTIKQSKKKKEIVCALAMIGAK